jgi:hypothetical protein
VELQAALADPRRPLDESQRQQVASLIEQTRAFVGRYRLRLSPSDAALMLDGTPLRPEGDAVLALAVGDHELRARAPGYGELRRVLQVQGREDEPLALELAPLASPAIPTAVPAKEEASALPPQRDSAGTKSPAFRTGAIVAFGVGGAAVVISAVMGGLALKRKQTVEDDSHCPNEACPPAYYHDKDQLLRFANASTATAVIGAAGLALGASLWLLGKRVRAAAARALRIESPTGLGFTTISGRF